jgi:predicted alpha/beta-fold hydrolase
MPKFEIRPFRPHFLLRGGHAQTLAGAYLPYAQRRYAARQHLVRLDDDDQLVLHDDCPADWQPGDRATLMLHGLAGCHESGYMQRISHKLCARGVRTFRMDLRGCGAGVHLARLPYHSGRSGDAAAALVELARLLPGSPVTLLGFSLGANITLKLLGELGHTPCGNLDSAMAVCPPIDLAACSRRISQPDSRRYDRFFLRLLLRQLSVRRHARPDAEGPALVRRPRTLWEFDNAFTAVVCGFGTADNYYREASSSQFVPHIRLPTLVLAAHDDPMIPSRAWESVDVPTSVQVHLSDHGGHLGFVGRARVDADRRWMDWRVVDWVLSRDKVQQATSPPAAVGQARPA